MPSVVQPDKVSGHIKAYAQIGIALSAEKDISKLFDMIVKEAMSLSSADAGTLYILDKKRQELRFEVLLNNTMKTRLGGKEGSEITIQPVPLYVDGSPNFSNVSSCVALTGKPVNIPDVYKTGQFDFTGPKKYDKKTGYRSKSMLVIPMKNHEDKIIGVLQLLNALDPSTGEIIPFSVAFEDLIASLASQAAVALNNAQLIKELELLFDAFIRSIATAIDEKSPYTGGHIKRVVMLTELIAEEINRKTDGPFKDVHLSSAEMEELKIAAWMHDVGKITTPEFIIDKMTKLETIFDRIQLVEMRFRLIRETMKSEFLEEKLALAEAGSLTPEKAAEVEAAYQNRIKTLDTELDFLKQCNNTGEFMKDEMLTRLQEISNKSAVVDGKRIEYLTPDETENLSIRKGTLTVEERNTIENHAEMTLKITSQLPFPDHLAGVPDYASAHHERLDGSGYPLGLTEQELPLQSRIIGIADIFEALTARDRPYKSPMKLSKALDILKMMKKDSHVDPDILELFISSGIFRQYAENELIEEQLDI